MISRRIPSTDLLRPFRASHDDMLWWSLQSCWSSIFSSRHGDISWLTSIVSDTHLTSNLSVRKTRDFLNKMFQNTLFGGDQGKGKIISMPRTQLSRTFSSDRQLSNSGDGKHGSSPSDNRIRTAPDYSAKNRTSGRISALDQVLEHFDFWSKDFYNRKNQSSGVEIVPDTYQDIPKDFSAQIQNLRNIIRSHNSKLVDIAWELWRLCARSLRGREELMQLRIPMFNYLREVQHQVQWQRMLIMFNDIPSSDLTEYDYRFKLWALICLDLSENIDKTFLECADRFADRMDMQWRMVEEYHLDRLEFDRLLILWGGLRSKTEPRLNKNPARDWIFVRSILARIANPAETMASMIDLYGDFGYRVSRKVMVMLAEAGSPLIAMDLYRKMAAYKLSQVDLARIVRLLNQRNYTPESFKLIQEFENMNHKTSHKATELIVNAKLETLAAARDYEGMQKLLESMISSGRRPTVYHYNTAMHAFGELGHVQFVNQLFEDMIKQNMRIPVQIIGTLMWSHLVVGDLRSVISIFDRVESMGIKRNEVLYNIAMTAYRELGDVSSIFDLFHEMTKRELKPNSRHITTLMSVFAIRADMENTKKVLQLAKENNISVDTGVFNAYAYAYIRSSEGDVETFANELWSMMQQDDVFPDTTTFTTLLQGLAIQDNSDGIQRLINKMNELSVPMNSVTYGIMIYYLGKIGQFELAKSVFDELKAINIEPDVFHYTSLMTMYMRKNEVDKVEETYREMIAADITPSFVTLVILMLSKRDRRRSYTAQSLYSMLNALQDILPTIDLTLKSYSAPKTTVPAFLIAEVMKFHVPEDMELYKDLLYKFEQLNSERELADQIKPDMRLEAFACIAARQADDWGTITNRWDRLLLSLAESHRKYDISNDSYGNIQNYSRTLLSRAFSTKVESLIYTGQPRKVEDEWERMESLGMQFSNHNWNLRVIALVKGGKFVEGCRIAHTLLRRQKDISSEYLKIISKGHLNKSEQKSHFHLERLTLDVLSKKMHQKFLKQAKLLKLYPLSLTDYQYVRLRYRHLFSLILNYRLREKLLRRQQKLKSLAESLSEGFDGTEAEKQAILLASKSFDLHRQRMLRLRRQLSNKIREKAQNIRKEIMKQSPGRLEPTPTERFLISRMSRQRAQG
ncbi:hypothetical protein V1511DRAFT_47695 [Dipodascopsis uninucleata]